MTLIKRKSGGYLYAIYSNGCRSSRWYPTIREARKGFFQKDFVASPSYQNVTLEQALTLRGNPIEFYCEITDETTEADIKATYPEYFI